MVRIASFNNVKVYPEQTRKRQEGTGCGALAAKLKHHGKWHWMGAQMSLAKQALHALLTKLL